MLKRKEFFAQLALLTSDALHSTRQHGLIIFDIDAFRFVNASSGYAAGDYLINLLEQYLTKLVPYGHIFANLGAGSFAILMPNTEFSDITELEFSIRKSVRERDFQWQEQAFRITLSSGSTLLLDNDDDESVSFSRAEIALFQAKQQGQDCMKFAHAPGQVGEVAVSSWAPNIQHAFLRDGFHLWLQPIFDTASKQVIMVDVSYSLDVDGEQIPAHVIQEEVAAIGMAVTLDRWLIRKLRDHLLSQQADGDCRRYVFKLSAASIKAAKFSEFLRAELSAKPEFASRLAAGLPYREMSADITSIRECVGRFRELGLPILLDDFGEGADGLLQLATLAVDYVRPQVQWFADGGGAASEMLPILTAFIKAANKQALGLGADTEPALEKLHQQGFTLAQGELYPAIRC